jgi:hypothetical protein
MPHHIVRDCATGAVYLGSLLAGAQWIYAQSGNAPCGIDVIRAGSEHVDDRFIPFPPDHVKFALLKAFPDVGWKVTKDEGFHLRGEKDMGLTQVLAQRNHDEGVKGRNNAIGALGKWTADIHEASQGGVEGSQLHIEFHSNKIVGRAAGSATLAQPLGEETACLAKLLSANDPVANPRGLKTANTGTVQPITIPGGTPVAVLLRDPLYSKQIRQKSVGATVNFEVADDVAIDGVVLIRRGALATGHFTDVEKTKGLGRHAQMSFAFDAVTAVDGQKIPVAAPSETVKGGRKSETAEALRLGVLGLFAHGADALIPAGTSYNLATSGEQTVGGH